MLLHVLFFCWVGCLGKTSRFIHGESVIFEYAGCILDCLFGHDSIYAICVSVLTVC